MSCLRTQQPRQLEQEIKPATLLLQNKLPSPEPRSPPIWLKKQLYKDLEARQMYLNNSLSTTWQFKALYMIWGEQEKNIIDKQHDTLNIWHPSYYQLLPQKVSIQRSNWEAGVGHTYKPVSVNGKVQWMFCWTYCPLRGGCDFAFFWQNLSFQLFFYVMIMVFMFLSFPIFLLLFSYKAFCINKSEWSHRNEFPPSCLRKHNARI